MRTAMGQVQMEHIVERVQKLPTLPAVANRITNLLNDPDCTAVKIAEILSTDQSLTARVLRLVNSAYYSLSAEVGSVRHAVALLKGGCADESFLDRSGGARDCYDPCSRDGTG